MAHNLEIKSNGQASFFSANKAAWHNLGTVVDGRLNAEEALKAANLDFTVEAQPLVTETGIIVPNHFANVRTDTKAVLGVVGDRYRILQNKDAFNFFDPIVDRDEAVYETAGVLGIGERVWIMAKLPEHIRIAGSDDIIEQYVVITNDHAGRGAIKAFITSVRVVCNNTLTAALGTTKNMVSIRHTENAGLRLAQAHEVLGISNSLRTELDEAFNAMADTKLKKAHVDQFLLDLLPDPNKKADGTDPKNFNKGKREMIYQALEEGAGHDMKSAKGTAFGLYNAITFATDHMFPYKDDSVKLKSIWEGGTAAFRQQSFEQIMKIC